jgi:hypothetical protein
MKISELKKDSVSSSADNNRPSASGQEKRHSGLPACTERLAKLPVLS